MVKEEEVVLYVHISMSVCTTVPTIDMMYGMVWYGMVKYHSRYIGQPFYGARAQNRRRGPGQLKLRY